MCCNAVDPLPGLPAIPLFCFIYRLWDHVSTNLSIYADASEVVHASGGDEELQQDDVSSDSVASEGPDSDDEEQAVKSSKGAEYTSVKEDRFRDEVEDRNIPTDNRYDQRTEERGGRARGYEEDSSRHRHGRDTSGRGGRGLEERHPERHREERRHGSPLGRHNREERLSHHGRHSKEKLHREQRGRGFQEQDRDWEEGRGRERERAREKERSRGHEAGLPPPPRGEPSFEERRGDREYGHRGEHQGRSEEAARVAGPGHDEMLGQKRVRSVAQADLGEVLNKVLQEGPGAFPLCTQGRLNSLLRKEWLQGASVHHPVKKALASNQWSARSPGKWFCIVILRKAEVLHLVEGLALLEINSLASRQMSKSYVDVSLCPLNLAPT
jgi:hypothetical protein